MTTKTNELRIVRTSFISSFLRLTARNFRASLDREFLIIQLVLPLFFIFVAGFGYTLLIPNVQGVSYETFLATGAIAMTVMSSSMLSGTMIWFDRNFGMFEQILIGPFTRAQYIASVLLTVILTGLASALVIFGFSLSVATGLRFGVLNILSLIGSLVLGSIFFGGFGIFVSLRVKSSEALAAMMNLSFFFFTFLSSVFYPSNSSLLILRIVFQINPLTYVADLVRNSLLGLQGFDILFEAAALSIECIFAALLASRAINKIEL